MPKALIFDPYFDTLGGGERYTLSVALCLQEKGYEVVLAWPNNDFLEKAQERFGLVLKDLKCSAKLYDLFIKKTPLPIKFQILRSFDLIFYVSDGSIPTLFGKKNLLHYQVPFTKINRFKLFNQTKLLTIDKIVVNSRFTQNVIDKTLGVKKSVVIYPPVDTTSFNPQTVKKNQILNVGRFVSPSHPKRQDVLIDSFKQFSPSHPDWELVLAGGHHGDDAPLEALKKLASGSKIKFMVNPTHDEIIKLFNESKIYWHAAGYEVDEEINPESVEHFGIVTVEAMAAGLVPIVIGKGGQKEIVDLDSGFLCQTIDDIVIHTEELIKNPDQLKTYSQQCVLRAQTYSQERFFQDFSRLVS